MPRLRFLLALCACVLFWAALGLLLGALGRHPLGGLVWGLLVGIAYVVVGSLSAEKFPKAVWDARLLENVNAPHLYEILRALCDRTGLPLPTLYFMPSPLPNAFVTADREGGTAIVVTSGLTRHLEKKEVQAVMALMVARLATSEMPSWTTAATLAGLPLQAGLALRQRPRLCRLGSAVLTVFAPPAAALLRLACNGSVITSSDYHAAHLTLQAGALQSALAKMEAARPENAVPEETVCEESGSEEMADGKAAAGNPATALLFAVPPFAALTLFPFLRLTPAADRAAHFADVVPAEVPTAVPVPDEEFRFY